MLNDYEEDVNSWFNEAGLEDNPFTLRINPDLFVGYQKKVKKLSYHIQENRKFALISGVTGSGKTTLLKVIQENYSEDFDTIYLSKPPEVEEIVDIFMEEYTPSLLERIFGINVSIHELSKYLNGKIDEPLLLLVDESHEAGVKALQWLRTITDQVDEMQLVMAGLPSVESKMKENVETLKSRITTRIDLTTLNEEETRNLIEKRIESSGGEDFGPFTEECVNEIYEKTGGFPREVLKICDKLINWALENDVKEIDSTEPLEEEEEEESKDKKSGKDLLKGLPYKQREIVKILAEEDELFPSEIAEELGTENYKTKQHAVRSVNNILRRLLDEGLVTRKRRGKGYIYSLDIKAKNLLVES